MIRFDKGTVHNFSTGSKDEKIWNYLISANQQPTNVNDIARDLGFRNKKEINPNMYAMESMGFIKRVSNTPPLWQVCNSENISDPSELLQSPKISSCDTDNKDNSMQGLSNMIERCPQVSVSDTDAQILQHLSAAQQPVHSDDIAKALGLQTKKTINPTLYKLMKEKLIKKVSASPPLWQIVAENHLSNEIAEELIKDSSFSEKICENDDDEGNSAGSQIHSLKNESTSVIKENSNIVDINQPLDKDVNNFTMENKENITSAFANISLYNNTPGKGQELSTMPLEQQVLAILISSCDPVKLEVLVKTISLRKKEVNQTLYGMQIKGLIKKVGDTPPFWQVLENGRTAFQGTAANESQNTNSRVSPSANTSVRNDMSMQRTPAGSNQFLPPQGQVAQNKSNSHFSLTAQERQLLDHLKNKGVINSSKLAHVAGFSSKKEINPTLYNLQKKGLIQKVTESPPQWQVTELYSLHSHSFLASSNPKLANSVPFTSNIQPIQGFTNSLGDTSSTNKENFAALNKNPISALTEYAQARKMKASIELLSETGPPHNPKFTMAAVVGRQRFPSVVATTKKDGRREAADLALRQIMGASYIHMQQQKVTKSNQTSNLNKPSSATHFDRIASLSHGVFNKIMRSLPEGISGRKVLAAIVMLRGDSDTGTVVSIGTGNRCITGEHLSGRGQVVNDSHAEIVCRRAFLRFLYEQVLKQLDNPEESIFQQQKDDSNKLILKPDVSFHLYISTAPCGDGALFSHTDSIDEEEDEDLYELSEEVVHRPIFSDSTKQGVLRTKMEQGEGTIPIEADAVEQTFDGILRGERLRTMSCSDKIARWNILGLQGALLSLFLQPIYLTSLTLGMMYSHGHLTRAICCRLARGQTDVQNLLPQLYKINHPQVGRVLIFSPPREVEKTKPLSVNWSLGQSVPEVIESAKGKVQESSGNQSISISSKRSLYGLFRGVCSKLNRSDLLSIKNYRDAKLQAAEYQTAKGILFKLCEENGYGKWMQKPPEEKMFNIDG